MYYRHVPVAALAYCCIIVVLLTIGINNSSRYVVDSFSVSTTLQQSRQQDGARPSAILHHHVVPSSSSSSHSMFTVTTSIQKQQQQKANTGHNRRKKRKLKQQHSSSSSSSTMLSFSYSSSSSSPLLVSSTSTCPSKTALSASTSIVDEVMDEMKRAMKSKDTTTLNTIRLIRSSFANAAIELRIEKLSDTDAQNVLKKLAKMRKESIDMYEKGGAIDRATAERAELDIISKWLPQSISDDTVRLWVQEAINEIQAQTKPVVNMGKVMGMLMKNHKNDNIDGSVAQRIVKEELAKVQ